MYSHTRLSTYEQCPLKYRFAYVDRVKVDRQKNVEAHLGTLVHDCLEHLYRDLQFEKINTLSELLTFFDELWESEWSDEIVINKKEYSSDNYRKMGRRFISDFYNRHHPFEDGRTISLEERVSFPLDHSGKMHIVGYIDRLVQKGDGHYEIHDYKTSSRLTTQEGADQERQLALYAIGVKEKFPDAKDIDLVWHYLAFDKVLKSHRSEEELSSLIIETKELISEIEECSVFQSNVTPLCDWCDYQPMCPEFSHLFMLESLPIEEIPIEDGVQLVDRYWTLKEELRLKRREIESELRIIEDEMERYAVQNNLNAIFGSQRKVKIIISEEYEFPKKNSEDQKRLISHLKNNGLWDSLTSLDNNALKKLLLSDETPPDLKEPLIEMLPKRVKRSFPSSKIDDKG